MTDTYDAMHRRLTEYMTEHSLKITRQRELILRRFMLRRGSGRIINISNVVGATGNAGQIPYTMVKAGLDAFTKSLAQELAKKREVPVPGTDLARGHMAHLFGVDPQESS